MLDSLSSKTGVSYTWGKDTCIWSWYCNAFLEHHNNLRYRGRNLYVITFEIDYSDVLLSDFDIWNERCINGLKSMPLVDICSIGSSDCIQAVSWSIPRNGILSVEKLEDFAKKYNRRNRYESVS